MRVYSILHLILQKAKKSANWRFFIGNLNFFATTQPGLTFKISMLHDQKYNNYRNAEQRTKQTLFF